MPPFTVVIRETMALHRGGEKPAMLPRRRADCRSSRVGFRVEAIERRAHIEAVIGRATTYAAKLTRRLTRDERQIDGQSARVR